MKTSMNCILFGFASLISSASMAGTCCHTPTLWTIKNLDKTPVELTCSLEKSAAWSGKPISMSTGTIAAGGSYAHTWDSVWYSDGMGMVPGTWACRVSGSKGTQADLSTPPLAFSTDWGENVTISWNKSKGTVARADRK